MQYEIDDLEEIGTRPDVMLSVLKRKELPEGKETFGQVYVNSLSSGRIRGNHYHKKRHEWISCVSGKVKITIIEIAKKESKSFVLDSEEKPLKRLHIYPLHVHIVENIGEIKAVIVEYSSEQHDPKNDDFFKIGVI